MKSFFFALLSALSFGTIAEAATYRDQSVSMRVVPVDLERYFV